VTDTAIDAQEAQALRERNRQTIQHVFTSLRELGEGPESALNEYFAREILFESPYRRVRLLGVDQIHRALRQIADQFTEMRHTDMVFTDGLSPDEFVWESQAEARFRATGEEYPQQYVVFCATKAGKIMTLRQYYNTRTYHLSNDAAPDFA
jgi:ketosteroid isomerase-like protein